VTSLIFAGSVALLLIYSWLLVACLWLLVANPLNQSGWLTVLAVLSVATAMIVREWRDRRRDAGEIEARDWSWSIIFLSVARDGRNLFHGAFS
jgi:hypothetical protein